MKLTIKQKSIAWNAGILHWKLHSAQLLIYKLIRSLPKDQRECTLFCARRFGKSFLGVILALEDCIQNPGVNVAIIGPKHKQTLKIVTFNLRKIIKDMPEGLITQSKSTSTWNFKNGSTLSLGGFDTIMESERGLDYQSIYLEETGLATADLEEYEYLLYSVLFPTMMHSRGRLTHLTTPSRIIDHPLHILTKVKCELANAFYSFTIEQNPLLSPEDIEKEIELLGGRGSTAVERELYCRIVRDESITVVTTFDEARHVAPLEHNAYRKYLISGDMGYTNDKTVFHLLAYDHDLGKTLVFDEKVFEPTTASSVIVESLKDWDKYGASAIADIQGNTRTDMSSLGFSAMAPEKDKFESTITFIRNSFYQDKVLIDPQKCPLLVQTCRSGTFNKQKTDFLRTSILGHCDSLMSLVYGLRSIDKQTDLRPKPDPSKTWTNPALLNPHLHNLRKLGHQ